MRGDPSKAGIELGWTREISFSELVKRMVDSDIQKAKRELEEIRQ